MKKISWIWIIIIIFTILSVSCVSESVSLSQQGTVEAETQETAQESTQEALHEIYLAGGCFWGTEEYFKRLPGVADTEVGYANGNTENPTYEAVCEGDTGFVEAVRVCYDPNMISLEILLKGYFQTIDPLSVDQQGGDIGSQYRTGIYYIDESDLSMIQEAVAKEQEKYEEVIATEVLPLVNFYGAEEYHQEYLKKNPGGYCHVDLRLANKLIKEEGLGATRLNTQEAP